MVDHIDYDLLWDKACHIFPILNQKLTGPTNPNNEDLNYISEVLSALMIGIQFFETIFIEIDEYLRKRTVPNFVQYFQSTTTNPENGFYQFQLAIHDLQTDYNLYLTILKHVQLLKGLLAVPSTNDRQKFDDMLKSTLLARLPSNFVHIVDAFYRISFKIFVNSHQQDLNEDEVMEDIEDIACLGCSKPSDNCRCQELICAFNKTNQHLTGMKLLDRLGGYTLTKLIEERISVYVQDTCKGIFDVSHLERLQKWLDTIVLNWLTRIFNRGSANIESEDDTTTTIREFKVKLSFYLYETYSHVIIDQFFNIIIDYPDSQFAIDDLKLCMEKLDLRSHLISKIKSALETRLLHPGVNTVDILAGYVATIKAIRHLDQSGVLLETMTEPVKEYLKSRPDTVRRVVTALTEEGPTDLAEELAKSEAQTGEKIKSNDDMSNWKVWQPDPIYANPKKASGTSRTADIISMVVDIYGTKELFVTEYRNLLADRLLTQLDFSPDAEIRNLELLKLRFGETPLHKCEVMLKDISDSKRINTHIHSVMDSENKFEISSLILSSEFWPAFKNETIELPALMQMEFERYTKLYEAYKGNRTLCWRPVIGRVDIEIELANRILELTVSPIQAAIIYSFQEKVGWTLEDLSQSLKIPATLLRKRIAYWQTQGLIKEQTNDFFVLDEYVHASDAHPKHHQHHDGEDDETESAMASASDQREEELQVFWSYIVGMLTNLDSLPLERIHQMLKMFASHGPGVEVSQDELKNFLQRKVRQHELTFAAGVYHLPK